MKKKLLITFFITILLIIAGTIISKHDSIKYRNVMNRNGVSEEALIVKTNSKDTIVNVLKDLSKHTKMSFKLHFISKNDPNFSYFYGQNEKLSIPMSSGRNFSELDFSAAVPFIIAGNNVEKTIKPQEQRYLLHDGNYIPVIGTAEMDGNSKLNTHIFSSISPNLLYNNAKISDYQVVLDGVNTLHDQRTIHEVKKAFHSKSMSSSNEKINNVKQKLIEKNSVEYLVLIIITIIIIVLNFNLIIPMKYSINNSQLDGDLQADFKFGFIIKYSLYNLIAFILAYIVIQNWILIINKTPFYIFFVSNAVLTIAMGFISIFTINRRFLD